MYGPTAYSCGRRTAGVVRSKPIFIFFIAREDGEMGTRNMHGEEIPISRRAHVGCRKYRITRGPKKLYTARPPEVRVAIKNIRAPRDKPKKNYKNVNYLFFFFFIITHYSICLQRV